jgi:hypothetical protein
LPDRTDPAWTLRCFFSALTANSHGPIEFWLSMPIRQALLWSAAFNHVLDPDRVR